MKLARRLGLAAVLATAVTGAGIAVAHADPSAGPSARPAAGSTDRAAQYGHGRRHLTPAERQELRSTGHTTLTRHTKRHGTVQLDVRRGDVTTASAMSLAVRSKDGSTATFTLDATSRVRSGGHPVTVKQGDSVLVVATSDGLAHWVRVRPTAAPGS